MTYERVGEKRAEDPRQNPIPEDVREEPITKDPTEDLITKEDRSVKFH